MPCVVSICIVDCIYCCHRDYRCYVLFPSGLFVQCAVALESGNILICTVMVSF